MVGISYGGALALALGYCLGSIPFGLVLTKLFGAGDLALDRLGQHRRDQRPAHRPQGARGRDAHARRAEGDARGRCGLMGVWAADRRSRPRRARSSATCTRSGSGSAAARAWRPISAASSASLWPAAIVFVLVWLAVAALTRYSSAAALAATLASPIAVAAIGESGAALVFAALSALIWVKHSANIVRLLNGSESKIGQKI